jgi:uncharacterized repeat protein (TIGR01451 family)
MISNLPNKFISGNIAHYLTSFNCLKFNFSRFFLNTGQMFILSLALIVNSTSSIAGSNSEFFNIRNGFFVSPRNGNSFFYNSGEIIPITYQAFAATLTVNMSQSGGPNPVTAAGDIIDYTIIIENTGDQIITGVTVTDVLPDGSDVILSGPTGDLGNIGDLDIGETWTYTISYTVTQDDIDAGINLTNTVFLDTDQTDPTYESALTVVSQAAAIQIVKSSTTPTNTYAQPGDVLTYDLVVTNTGSVTLTNIVVTDPGAAVTGSPVASLAPAASVTLTASYTILQADVDAGSFTNTATATGNYGAAQSVSDTDTETVTATQAAAIQIVKSSTTPTNTYSQPGDVLTYDLVVTNTGSVTLTNIVVTDPGAAVTGSPVASLAPAASVTLTASYTILQADVDAGSFTNTATATGNYGAAQSVSDTDTETVTATQAAAIQIVKSSTTPTNTYSQPGDVLTYDLVVTNTGSVTLTNIVVTDPGAAVTGSVASLAPAASVTLTASYTILQADVDAGSFTNTATATGNYGAAQSVSDTDTETVTATQAAAIQIVKSSTTPTNTYSQPGDVLTYDLVVTNTGSVTLTNIVVTDPGAAVTGSWQALLLLPV